MAIVAGGAYGATGETVLADAAADHAYAPIMVRLASGGFATVWSTGYGLESKVYDANGIAVGPEQSITARGEKASLVALSDGGYAVAWYEGSYPSQGKLQFFDAAGHAAGLAQSFSDPNYATVSAPSLTTLPEGRVTVFWQYYDYLDLQSYIRIFAVNGTSSPTTQITVGLYDDATLLGIANGHILINASTQSGVNVLDYDPSTNTFGSSINLASSSSSAVFGHGITKLSSGNILFTWREQDPSNVGEAVLKGRILTPDGADTHAGFSISTTAFGQAVAALPNGSFVVTYMVNDGISDVTAQLFSATAMPIGDPFKVAETSISQQLYENSPDVVAYGNDNFAITFGGGTANVNGNEPSYIRFFAAATNGASGDEALTGGPANDFLQGLAGNDALHGAGGNDLLVGGSGADLIDGGTGNDVADYSSSGAAVTINLATGQASGGDATGDVLISIENLVGSAFADLLVGDAGANRLDGGLGDDVLVGGGGADMLVGGGGRDTADYSASSAAVMVRLGFGLPSQPAKGGDAEGDILLDVANVRGSSFDDTLVGNFFQNRLEGLAGDDILTGGSSDDILDGGAGNDIAVIAATSGASFVHATAAGDLVITSADGVDTLRSIETIRFSDKDVATPGLSSLAPVVSAYQTYGGRDPSFAEVVYWSGQLADGHGVGEIRAAILNDPLGRTHTAAVVTDLYQTYGGRAPSTAELGVWQNNVVGGASYDDVRSAILNDPLGRAHTAAVVTDLYQTYGGRAPSTAELGVWQNNVAGGASYDDVRSAILNDPLGRTHTAAVVTDLYQTYGGRAPSTAELGVWQNNVAGGATYGDVRSAILDDPLGQNHSSAVTSALYQQFFGRAPGAGEIQVWKDNIYAGADFATLIDALMSDGGSAGHVGQIDAGPLQSVVLQGRFGEVAVSHFDPVHDVIDLRSADRGGIDPLDGLHARDVRTAGGGNDVLITFGTDQHLLLHDVRLAQLSAADFLI